MTIKKPNDNAVYLCASISAIIWTISFLLRFGPIPPSGAPLGEFLFSCVPTIFLGYLFGEFWFVTRRQRDMAWQEKHRLMMFLWKFFTPLEIQTNVDRKLQEIAIILERNCQMDIELRRDGTKKFDREEMSDEQVLERFKTHSERIKKAIKENLYEWNDAHYDLLLEVNKLLPFEVRFQLQNRNFKHYLHPVERN